MKKQVIKETFTYMWRNKKNRLVMVLCLGVLLLHSLVILPNTPGLNEVNVTELERGLESNRQTFEDQLDSGQTLPSFMTGTSAYEAARNEYVNQRELLAALRTGDAKRYLNVSYRPPVEDDDDEEGLFSILGRGKEMPHQFLKNNFYTNEVESLSFHTVHERTSLQQLHLFMIGFGPYILFFLLLFMISDVTTKDRKLRTQKVGNPLNWFTYLFIQSLTALGFVLLFFLASTVLFTLINGLLHGFGSFSLPVGSFELPPPDERIQRLMIGLLSIGGFLLRILPYLFLLLYGFTRLTTLFSLLFKHDVVVLVTTAFVLLFPQLYYGAETTELLGIDISWYPQTYFHFGEVVTGRLGVPYGRGLIVLAITLVILELLIGLASKKITRQKFVH